MEEKQSDLRTSPRCQLPFRAEARLECGVIVEGRVVDMSHSGLLFETERSLPLSCEVRIVLYMEGHQGPHRLDCQGVVARLDPRGVAINFSGMTATNLSYLQYLLCPDDSIDNPALAAKTLEPFTGEFF